ncbi:hypothetical protein CLOM_g22791 [Closterium sp. NIES-68]|nr:hypothetical protein CLOM_g22791 [Closterium sp. NIES-68]GJP76527.1 hypothetical protein CLOP_g6958 [Closterium sp. NIES-67]
MASRAQMYSRRRLIFAIASGVISRRDTLGAPSPNLAPSGFFTFAIRNLVHGPTHVKGVPGYINISVM